MVRREKVSVCTRGFTKFGIKVLWRLQFFIGYRTLDLKFQKARTKIEVVLSLPSWLSQLNWDSNQGRVRTTSILVRAFWNFKLKVLKYPRNCSLHNTLIPWSLKNPVSPNVHTYRKMSLIGQQFYILVSAMNLWDETRFVRNSKILNYFFYLWFILRLWSRPT